MERNGKNEWHRVSQPRVVLSQTRLLFPEKEEPFCLNRITEHSVGFCPMSGALHNAVVSPLSVSVVEPYGTTTSPISFVSPSPGVVTSTLFMLCM